MITSNSNVSVYGDNYFYHNAGGYILLSLRSMISIHGNIKFISNKVKWEWGGTVVLINSTVKFRQTAELVKNEGKAGGAIALYENSQLVFWEQSKVIFLRNHAEKDCGAVLVDVSTLAVQRGANVSFLENNGHDGGALALKNGAMICIRGSHGKIMFTQNHALHYGGALYVTNTRKRFLLYRQATVCFYQTLLPRTFDDKSISSLVFANNTADISGNSLYGGWVDLCTTNVPAFDTIFHFEHTPHQLSAVSSNPTRVCVCINDLPNCNITQYNVTVYPGETFQIPAVAVGQRFRTVPFIVHARFTSVSSSIPPQMKPLQETQTLRGTCSNLRYNIFSTHKKEDILLSVDKINVPHKNAADIPRKVSRAILLQFTDLHVQIWLNPCPLGFELKSSSCTCHPQLQQHKINCSIDTQKVNRPPFMWVNATLVNASQCGIIVIEYCPFDYCKPDSFNLNLEDPDEQCAFNRTGILCGACQRNLSHVFGTSACRECSSLWALLWVPVIALAGIALVVLLIVLNLTVSVGTINGLIFYANIVRANHATFFPPNTSNSFLSWFIAWINLDLGIETCFYNGLDAYVKTWLQFVFPLYIWFLVITIIVLSHYSTNAARLSGRNAVPVLATLFLLSYAKLLRIIITVFQSMELEYSNTFVRKVWLYDANVNYLKGKHIPLFMAALLLLLISLPYAVILIFIQYLQHWSSYRVFFWVKKLKPLFDAYTGPYKDRHRYWTGLLMLVRIVLFLIFAINTRGSADVNLLAIILVILSLFMYVALAGTVYKAWSLNAIEYSYFLNLGVLSSATFYTTVIGQSKLGVVYTSVGITFTQFIIIAALHVLKRFSSLQHCNNCASINMVRRVRAKLSKLRSVLKKICYKQKKPHHDPQPRVTHASIELRESLLEHCSEFN